MHQLPLLQKGELSHPEFRQDFEGDSQMLRHHSLTESCDSDEGGISNTAYQRHSFINEVSQIRKKIAVVQDHSSMWLECNRMSKLFPNLLILINEEIREVVNVMEGHSGKGLELLKFDGNKIKVATRFFKSTFV